MYAKQGPAGRGGGRAPSPDCDHCQANGNRPWLARLWCRARLACSVSRFRDRPQYQMFCLRLSNARRSRCRSLKCTCRHLAHDCMHTRTRPTQRANVTLRRGTSPSGGVCLLPLSCPPHHSARSVQIGRGWGWGTGEWGPVGWPHPPSHACRGVHHVQSTPRGRDTQLGYRKVGGLICACTSRRVSHGGGQARAVAIGMWSNSALRLLATQRRGVSAILDSVSADTRRAVTDKLATASPVASMHPLQHHRTAVSKHTADLLTERPVTPPLHEAHNQSGDLA